MRRASIAALAVVSVLIAAPAGAQSLLTVRANARASGGDRPLAVRIATRLLADPLPAQLLRVRCERVDRARFCGLTLSAAKFTRPLDREGFAAEVDSLVAKAFAVDAAIAEVDLWAVVPIDAGHGAIVSGDYAKPTQATVFATTAIRADRAAPSMSRNAYWDARFEASLEREAHR